MNRNVRNCLKYGGKGKLKKLFASTTIFLIVFSMFSALAPQVKAQAISSTSDPTDDLYLYQSGSPAPTWPVIDIVYAEISQVDAANIKLSIKANQPIPLTNQWQGYNWLLDTGIPAPPYWNPIDSNDITVSYHVGVHWAATGPLAVDITNDVDGTTIYYEDARDYPEKYFSGDTVSVTIPLILIGNPTSIKWVAGSTDGVASPSGRHDKAPNTGHITLTIEPEAEVDDYVCYNHYPYLPFSSQAEFDNHVSSVHGSWLEYNFRFAFGLHEWNVFEKVGQLLRGTFIVGDELGNERIPVQPQIGPNEGFVTWSGEVLVTNPYTDKIVALVGFNQFGDHMQTVWLSPKGTPGESQWFDDINRWMVELHFKAVKRVLRVPYYGQGDSGWCALAAASMILKYFALNIHMWDIGEELQISRNPPVRLEDMSDYVESKGLQTEWRNFEFYLPSSDLKDFLVSALDSDKPVVLSMSAINHAVVVVGYSAEDPSNPTFYIHDPSGTLVGAELKLGYRYPYIAIPVSWDQLLPVLDRGRWHLIWARAFSVTGTIGPSLGSIDIGNNIYAHNPRGTLRNDFDRGISWRRTGSHSFWLDETDTLFIQPQISNQQGITEDYRVYAEVKVGGEVRWADTEILYDVPSFSSKIYSVEVPLNGIVDPTKNNRLSLQLWDFGLTTLYDLITIELPLHEPVPPEETILFSDDFESYGVGTFPSPHWELWFNNNGEIVSGTYVSPTKSLRLRGSYGWSTEAITRFTSSSRVIGYEVYGRVESIGEAHSLTVGFAKRTGPGTSDWYAAVGFKEDGMIHTDFGGAVQLYVPNRWYKIRVTLDRDTGEVSFWIDDQFISSGIVDYGGRDLYALEGFNVASEWATVNCYFDDVKVFEASAILNVVAESPVNILVTAPNGLRIGYDSLTDSVVSEVEGVTYSGPGTEPQVIAIPSPSLGVYIIEVFGTGTGSYTIRIESAVADSSAIYSETWTRTTSPGELHTSSIQLFEDGSLVKQIFGVIPEVPWGTVMASAAMIIALVAYIAVPKWRRKRKYVNQ